MKLLYFFVFSIYCTYFAHAQITYEKGCYINNLDERMAGYIKNQD